MNLKQILLMGLVLLAGDVAPNHKLSSCFVQGEFMPSQIEFYILVKKGKSVLQKYEQQKSVNE